MVFKSSGKRFFYDRDLDLFGSPCDPVDARDRQLLKSGGRYVERWIGRVDCVQSLLTLPHPFQRNDGRQNFNRKLRRRF